jgi:hypothetical protein
MTIVPTRVQEQIDRVDRNRSLAIGVATGLTALWSLYRVLWAIYGATALASVGWSPVALIFPLVLWGVIGVVAGIASVAFLLHYSKQT